MLWEQYAQIALPRVEVKTRPCMRDEKIETEDEGRVSTAGFEG